MSKQTPKAEGREWWIRIGVCSLPLIFEKEPVHITSAKKFGFKSKHLGQVVHVIEKSAFDDLAAELERVKDACEQRIFNAENLWPPQVRRAEERASRFMSGRNMLREENANLTAQLKAAKDRIAELESENKALIIAHDTQVTIAKEFQKIFIQVKPEMEKMQERIKELEEKLK